MHDPYSLPYLHHSNNHRVDHRQVPRQLPSPPSPDVLSKPPASPTKKQGPPKGKGAVRAKSGCYTCRIRRKKCDETQDQNGSCQTCVRLRLECLGFGAKRPDWMRENNSVPELRDKIKQFLASQGMIKGHSGSGARNNSDGSNNNPGPILTLSQDVANMHSRNNNSSSNGGSCPSSPQSPPSATTSASHHSYPHIVTSAMRDDHRTSDVYSPLSPDSEYHHSPASYTPLPPMNSQSSLHTHGLLHPVNDMSYLPSYVPTHAQHSGENNGSSVSPTSQLHHHTISPMTPIHSSHSYINSPPPPPPVLPPLQLSRNKTNSGTGGPLPPPPLISLQQQRSSEPSSSIPHGVPISPTSMSVQLRPREPGLSRIYTAQFNDEDDDQISVSSPNVNEYMIPQSLSLLPDPVDAYYISYYLKEVFGRQYLLADATIAQFLFHFAATSDTAKNSMCLLSSLHMHCMRHLNAANQPESPSDTDDIHRFYRRVKDALTLNERSKAYTEGDAMAGLHVVSSFLFSGGRGPWPQFLCVAIEWVRTKLNQYPKPVDALVNASESERFIVRTTMWFDVWASITQLRQPEFLEAYRSLFGHSEGRVGEDPMEATTSLSMMNIVGCTNTSFRAMAEIATLAQWKNAQQKAGSLSVPKLVERGLQIEEYWLPRDMSHGPQSVNAATDIDLRRKVVANVFRASARVYLHMVLSRSFPNAPEIKDGVAETITYMRQVPTSDQANSRAVIRSVIFAICICGCLTQDSEQQQFFLRRLDDLGEEANVFGNCRAVKNLMQMVWTMREETGNDVDWRQVMRDEEDNTLLLV